MEDKEVTLIAFCDMALSKWGFEAQMDVAVEELLELGKAILKYRREPTPQRARHIAEEMADVTIMMKQVDIAMSSRFKDFDEWIDDETYRKLQRLSNMLNQP